MPERKQLFDDNWRFKLGDTPDAPSLAYNDVGWRSLDLPHDWSVEADFDAEVPAGNDGGYLSMESVLEGIHTVIHPISVTLLLTCISGRRTL